MAICQGCGGSYDDQFKFCPFCGRSKPEPAQININVTSADYWETCEICLVETKPHKGYMRVFFLEASAIGPQGPYQADRSEDLFFSLNPFGRGNDYRIDMNYVDYRGKPIPILKQATVQPKLDALIKRLTTAGWQPFGRGEEWYNERFRRLVKK